MVSPITVVPSGAGPTKFVLLSIVVVPLPSGRLSTVAAAPSVSAKAITAPPCRIAGTVHRSAFTGSSAVTLSGLTEVIFSPISSANGRLGISGIASSGFSLLRSSLDGFPGSRRAGSAKKCGGIRAALP